MKSNAKNTVIAATSVAAVNGIMLSSPSLAFASGEEAQGAAGIAAILPNMLEFVPMLIAFIALWFVLAKFGWPMFDAMLKKREETVKDSLDKSQAARIESEKLLEEYKEQLKEAKSAAATIVADARLTAEEVKRDITAKAEAEAAIMIENAKSAIATEKKLAIAQLQTAVADTSVDIATRLIGNDLTTQEHREIIKRYVDEAGSFNVK